MQESVVSGLIYSYKSHLIRMIIIHVTKDWDFVLGSLSILIVLPGPYNLRVSELWTYWFNK